MDLPIPGNRNITKNLYEIYLRSLPSGGKCIEMTVRYLELAHISTKYNSSGKWIHPGKLVIFTFAFWTGEYKSTAEGHIYLAGFTWNRHLSADMCFDSWSLNGFPAQLNSFVTVARFGALAGQGFDKVPDEVGLIKKCGSGDGE